MKRQYTIIAMVGVVMFVALFATLGAASLAYIASCFLLRVEETKEAGQIVLRKLRRKPGP